jgi:hypothetical protein
MHKTRFNRLGRTYYGAVWPFEVGGTNALAHKPSLASRILYPKWFNF